MDSLNFEHTISKIDEGTYYTIPFNIPRGSFELITISYSYKRFAGRLCRPANMINVVDLGLIDPSGKFLGWSGSARGRIFVGPYTATSGYLMTNISPGEWRILVGAYKIPKDGLVVRYKIEFTPAQPRWFVGDLHMHSTASDGQHDRYTLAKMAKEQGLDFIAISDHNNYSENLQLPRVPGLTIIPAVEWTHYLGHMNFLGVPAPFENSFVANSEEEMLAVVGNARKKGALISVNHPNCNLCPYLWLSEDSFDLVEVWNGPMRKVNLDGIAWWHKLLQEGRRIPLVGGSDFHRSGHIVRFARPVTRVFAESPAAKDILRAISKGHSHVTASVKGVQLELRCGDKGFGDSVKWLPGQTLTLAVNRLRSGMRVKLITQDGPAHEWRHFRNGSFQVEIPTIDSWKFAYVLVSRRILGMEFVRAISNPIYFSGIKQMPG